MKKTLQLNPIASLTPIIGKGNLVAFDVGPDRIVYLAIANLPLDYRETNQAGSSFAKTATQSGQNYRIVGLDSLEIVYDTFIEGERFNIHHVQPLPEGILLACTRSHYKGPNNFEKNGRVYSKEGQFDREILLGDGIESVQTTDNGVIWTSYFDEGVFGNYGWPMDKIVGNSGLVAWDSITGKGFYQYEPKGDLGSICDCYAMNVESENNVWIYYYTDFPLVHIQHQKIKSNWTMNLEGSRAFAVLNGYVLFSGGYDEQNTYRLYSLHNSKTALLLAKFVLLDQMGEPLIASDIVGRANTLYLLAKDDLYQFDVETAVLHSQ